MKTICVPFDFSRQSERALSLAMQGFPFGTDDVVLDVCHVVDRELYRRMVGRDRIPSNEAVHAYLGDYIRKHKTELGGRATPSHRVTVRHGRPVHEIIEHQNAIGAQGVMIGGQGHGGITERLLGRTAQRVLRKGFASTYIVKETGFGLDDRAVLCAVDCTEGSKVALLEAHRLSERYRRPLEILYVVELVVAPYIEVVGSEALQAAEVAAQAVNAFELKVLGRRASVVHHVEPGPPARTIVRIASERRCGLVVLGSHGHGPAEHLLLGSVSEGVALGSPVDVLIVRAPVPKPS